MYITPILIFILLDCCLFFIFNRLLFLLRFFFILLLSKYRTILWVITRCNFISDWFWFNRFINFIRFMRHRSISIVLHPVLSLLIILFLFFLYKGCFHLRIFFANGFIQYMLMMKLAYRISLTDDRTHLFHLGLSNRWSLLRLFLNWISSNLYRLRHLFGILRKLNGSTKSKIFPLTT